MWPTRPERDDFDGTSLGPEWNFLRNPEDWSWSLAERPGWLRLKGAATSLDEAASPAWIGRRQEHFLTRVTTRLDFAPRSERECAGLTVWMNERHHYDLFLSLRGGKRCLVVNRRIGSLAAEVACRLVDSSTALLRVDAEREIYRFSGSAAPDEPDGLASGETRYLATEVAGGFTGMYVAMFSSGNGMPCSSPADFDWFEYSPR